jgi:glycosyltransferase involved in cell wall biosynthesis
VVVIGDGPERVHLEDHARRLGVEDRIRFLGYRADAWDHATDASAFVHPSLREGLGLAVMEAMMRGLPVVAAAVGGTPDLIAHERTGLLVPPADARALSEGMMRLISDPALADHLGRSGRQHALQSFDMEHFLDAHYALYGRLLRRRG